MPTTLTSTILGVAIGAALAWTLFLANDLLFHSGTRAPTTLDYYIGFGLIILPILGGVAGSALGLKLSGEGRTAAVFFTTSYGVAPLVLIVLLGLVLSLYAGIHERATTPRAQNDVLVTGLQSTSWIRRAGNPELKAFAAPEPYRIETLSFKNDSGSLCPGDRSYELSYASGKREQGCWDVLSGTDTLRLSAKDGVSIYGKVRLTPDSLSFERGSEMWTFSKREGTSTDTEYSQLRNADIRAANGTAKSLVAESDRSLGKEFIVYTPADAEGGRVEIQDKKTGKTCVSGDYLVTGIAVSKDETTALIYNYSGSNQYIDTIDTATCKPVAPRQTLP